MDDVTILKWVAGGSFSAVIALIGLVWNDNVRRVSKVEGLLENKAEKEVVETHRTYFAKVFEKLDEIKDQMHNNHIEALKALSGKADR